MAALQYTYAPNQQLNACVQSKIRRIINSLDTAVRLGNIAYPREAFLSALALSIQIFLEIVLCQSTNIEDGIGDMAVQLKQTFQRPELRLPSSLGLCSSLESLFWQTMIGAVAAPDDQTRLFFTSRLDKIAVALALTSWNDASVILQRFFWIPSIFSDRGHRILSVALHWEDHANI